MEVEISKRTCLDCRFAVMLDEGYSNYTVEGTTFNCAKKLHPAGEFDKFYGEDKRLEFGAGCEGFDAGEPIDMDVERDNVDELTPEQLAVWRMLAV